MSGYAKKLTGGLAPLVINEVSAIHHHEPWLTLIGLRLVYERNVGTGAPARGEAARAETGVLPVTAPGNLRT